VDAPTDPRRIAAALVDGFDRHYSLFRDASARAKERFEQADWAGAQRAVKERIAFYDDRVLESVERIRAEFGHVPFDRATWQEVKREFIPLLVDHKRPELAETFFNSATTRLLGRSYFENDLVFVRAAISTEYIESDPPVYRTYYPADTGLRETLCSVFRDFGWTRPFDDLERDVEHVVRALRAHLGAWPAAAPNLQLHVLASPCYRNKGAYVIARIVNGSETTPVVVPVLHDEGGRLVLDTVLFDHESIAILFSLSRAYFMADMDVPSGYVQFLQTLMPRKPRSELYTALGLGKQGKTLFVRDLRQHLHHSQDLFVEARGTRGKVMHVFNLPSYPYVFKVIKDVFGSGKHTDRATVMSKFALVKEVDRVGRMADTIEFKNLALPLDRFAPELLQQLQELAPSSIDVEDDQLIIRHCYLERRLTPLNLFLDGATDEQREHAVREYGDAIRELAIANVFPGDLLWRNFGITTYGRVVFYDYDEVEYMTDCTFRRIPPPPTPEAELAAEPWYPVGRLDVFPEEFETFVLGDRRVREAFRRYHDDLLRPEFWQDAQRRVGEGEIVDFFPYAEAVRFSRRSEGPQRAAFA
jgi:isocitrate dehydrogenase kinase/phosphatase